VVFTILQGLVDDLFALALCLPEIFNLSLFFPALELPLLLEFILEHILQSFEVPGLAHHPRPFFRSNVPLKIIFFLVASELNSVRD
jgi:hypothetical protein